MMKLIIKKIELESETEKIYRLTKEILDGTRNLSDRVDGLIEKLILSQPRSSKPTETDMRIYYSLSDVGLTVKEIIRETGLRQPSISRSLKRLRELGLVKRSWYEGPGARYIYTRSTDQNCRV